MVSRLLVASLAVLALAACDHSDKAATEAGPQADAGAQTPSSPAEAVLAEVWQAANPGRAAPDLDTLSAAFDPGFAQIHKAGNDADNASITSTLAFLKAVQATDPTACVDAPLARFRPEPLAAIPAEALPAFRAMLTDRLALISQGAARAAPPEDLMSGSMQNFALALSETTTDLLPRISAGQTFDAVAGCAATIEGWQALEKGTQSPQLVQMLYGIGDFSAGE